MLTDDPIVQVKCGYLHPRLTCSDQYICQNRHRRLPFDDPLCTVERLLKFVRGNPEFHKPSSRRRSFGSRRCSPLSQVRQRGDARPNSAPAITAPCQTATKGLTNG